jgi:hypothetical protein
MKLLDSLKGDRRISEHYRMDSVRAHMLEMRLVIHEHQRDVIAWPQANGESLCTQLPSDASRAAAYGKAPFLKKSRKSD